MFKHFGQFGIYTSVNRILASVIALVITIFAGSAPAAATRAMLLLSANTAQPGETVTAAVRLQMDPGWHTYWKHGGDSGGPTRIEWELPSGVTAGEIQWPTPEKYLAEGFTTYVYHDEVLLLVPLKLAENLARGVLTLKAEVSWLECEKLCVPGKESVSATLTIGATTIPSAQQAAIDAARSKLPLNGAKLSPRAAWEKLADGDTRSLLLEWDDVEASDSVDFFPEGHEGFEVATTVESAGPRKLRLQVVKHDGDWPREFRGLLLVRGGGATRAFAVTVPIQGAGAAVTAATTALPQSLGLMLVFAFIGGLILNIMPCVLPVIALKILGFVGQAKESPGRVKQLGLVYALGVLVSFLGLAALVIGVKSAGQAAGWGMQFSSPQFTIAFAVLVTLVALNLFGVFEVTLGGGVMSTAGELASRHGVSGAFFHGMLATVLATPCTAPFLSPALGFAFSQNSATIVLIFLMVGAGLASPYVVLSWFPAWLKWLPKPGVWMERFKIAMGFPMLATALWLVSLVTDRYGERAWWLGMFLLFVALAAWIFGTFIQRGAKRKSLALAFLAGILALGYFWVLEGQLQWRTPIDSARANSGALKNAPKGYEWQRWSAAAVKQAQAERRVVIVDFTAKWCITCNAIVKPALEREAVLAELKQHKTAAFLADYTDYPADLTAEMKRYNRAAVPLVLVFPPRVNAVPAILPDPNPVLGPGTYAEVILAALREARSAP
jgi:thiol:disulfide interchange protein/DsbC/DsbD-like thiol-disulfide interchange protein